MLAIETKSLVLRPLSNEDISQRYVDWLNDPEVNRFLETRHSIQTIDSCATFIKSCNSDPNSHLFGVFLKSTNQHIGNAKLGFINTLYNRGQVSLFIGEKSEWGKGLSTEIVQAITQHGFENLNLHRIEAGCYESNLASLRVFLKSGYTVDGFLRDHVIHHDQYEGCFLLSILKHEFKPLI